MITKGIAEYFFRVPISMVAVRHDYVLVFPRNQIKDLRAFYRKTKTFLRHFPLAENFPRCVVLFGSGARPHTPICRAVDGAKATGAYRFDINSSSPSTPAPPRPMRSAPPRDPGAAGSMPVLAFHVYCWLCFNCFSKSFFTFATEKILLTV